MPTLEEINAVAPNHAVLVKYLYAHAWLNKAVRNGYNGPDAGLRDYIAGSPR